MKRLLILCIAMSFTASAMSQSSTRAFKQVRSPEVSADRRVTFRHFAPNAKKVLLARESAAPAEMAKDEKGIWSFTTAPLEPDFYNYYFMVDGVQAADPANELMKTVVTGGIESILHVPGPTNLSWEENDVPHGVIHRHRYRSKTLGEYREFLVYTPPNFDPKATYPTLYLLHGVMEDQNGWTASGRAHVILDNLIAQKKAKPMLIVMPLSYGFANAPDRVGDVLTGKANHREDFARLGQTIFNEIMPAVENGYRASKKREDRAIAGLSMGGAQALYFGLNHADRFGSAATFSAAFVMYGGKHEDWFPNVGKAKLPSLTIACGAEDFLAGSNRAMKRWLSENKVSFQDIETPGAHTWQVWRRNLESYALTLFQKR